MAQGVCEMLWIKNILKDLGIEVARSKSGIFLSQRKYVFDLLTETSMLDCKPAETPIEMNHKLGILPNQTQLIRVVTNG